MQAECFKFTSAEALTLLHPEEEFLAKACSPAMRRIVRIVSAIAPTDIPLLLAGESGTGKDTLAVRIHKLSRRRDEPFLKLVCPRLVPEVLDRLLLEDGNGFEGLRLSKAGTIFLDEIGELDAACQSKLLQVLPGSDGIPSENSLRVRVISSTRHNLEEEIWHKRFSEDLYLRLNGILLRLPPLRHRKEDLPALVDLFLTKYTAQMDRPSLCLSKQSLSLLLGYSWPGNIRQLENVIRKIVALDDEKLALTQMVTSMPLESANGDLLLLPSLKQAARTAARQAERELILRALNQTHWKRKQAAKELQISYKALLYKLKQIGLADSKDYLGS